MMENYLVMSVEEPSYYSVTPSSASPPPPWPLQRNDDDEGLNNYSYVNGLSLSTISASLSMSTNEPFSSVIDWTDIVLERESGDGDKQNVSLSSSLPMDFTEISELNKYCIVVYTVLFFLGAVGNVLVLACVSRHNRLRKSRTHLLIMNLCIADFIVIFFLMPTEIFWRYTIAWEGGDVLCKVSQFLRAFGLYLSSNVVICISVDRYFAIVYPLKLAGAVKRVRWMVVGAWIVSAVFAGPQILIYHVASHPIYPEFRQCVTKAFLMTGPYNELIYNVSSVAALYIIPLLVIIYTYTMILWKIHRKSKEQRVANSQQEIGLGLNRPNHQTNATLSSSHLLTVPRDVTVFHRPSTTGLAAQPAAQTFLNRAPSKRTRLMLRSTANQTATLTRARSRTLRLTLLILLTYILSWSPYTVMTLWYMLDRGGASQVDERVQEALFIMAVTNSVLNPLIYGTVGRKEDCKKRLNSILLSSSLLKSICCFFHLCNCCCEQGEHTNSETVVITMNRLDGSRMSSMGNMRHSESHSHITCTSPNKKLSPLSPRPPPTSSALPCRSQIVTLRVSNNNGTEAEASLKFGRSYVPPSFIPRGGNGNNEGVLVKTKDECLECGASITMQYIVQVEDSKSSQGSTHV